MDRTPSLQRVCDTAIVLVVAALTVTVCVTIAEAAMAPQPAPSATTADHGAGPPADRPGDPIRAG